ncbi:MAG: polysaccharide biosynthesis C-terminal domain-containing protein [Armatimonadota bacterium]|nr:MAG: polysaccharide biosynthesis C-terminal domain-containing protein [Armatimonadota bacterium]
MRADAASVLAAQVVALTAGLASSIITARVLGPSGRGIFALVTLWVSLFALAVPLSSGYGLIYNIRRSRATFSQALSGAVGLAALLGAIAAGLAVAAALAFSRTFLSDVPLGYVVLGAAALPAAVFNGLSGLALTGAGRVRQASAIAAAGSAIAVLLLAAFLLVLHLGVWGAVLASSLASLLAAAITLVWLRSDVHLAAVAQPALWRSSVRFGLKLHGGTVAQWANYSLDRFLINIYLGPGAVGIYAVAAALAERLWMLPGAVGASLFSRTGGDAQNDAEITARACRSTVWLMAGACLVLGVAAPFVIPVVFGADFAAASTPLRVLLPGVLLLSAGKTVVPYITNHNRPWTGTWISLISLGSTLILNVLLIPRLGIVGSALASTIAYGANGVLHCLVFVRLTRVAPARLMMLRATHLPPIPPGRSRESAADPRLHTVAATPSVEREQ